MNLAAKRSVVSLVVLYVISITSALTAAGEPTLWLKKDDGRVIEVALDRLERQDRRVVAWYAEGESDVAEPVNSSLLKAEVVSLKIACGTQPFEATKPYDLQASESTELELLITGAEGRILAFEDGDSELIRFHDGQGNDLLEEIAGGDRASFGPFPRRFAGGRQCLVTVNAPCRPGRGATKVHLQAVLVCLWSSGETVTEEKKIVPRDGGSFTVGAAEVQYSNKATSSPFAGFFQGLAEGMLPAGAKPTKEATEKPPQKKGHISLTSKSSFDSIQSIVFLGPDGKPIPHESMGSGSTWSGDATLYSTGYELEREVETLTVRLTYYKDVKRVNLPVDLEIDLGL